MMRGLCPVQPDHAVGEGEHHGSGVQPPGGKHAIPEAEFKVAMRQVASSVAVVTARSEGVRNGLTATAVCSVSASPPTMLICVNRDASADRLIGESGAFAINFLTEDQHTVARLFSTSKLAPEDRFAEGSWVSMATGAPMLEGALASFDCRVESRVVSGTHHVYFGVVAAVTSLAEGVLLYRDGSFRRLEPAE